MGAVLLPFACDTSEEEDRSPLNTITDYDGNTYHTVKIGNQWWMASNLETTHYADGSEIPRVESKAVWEALDSEDSAYCYYNNNSSQEAFTYGALYTWAAALNGAESSDSNHVTFSY